MVCCCVIFCKSTKGVTNGVSFHEFPNDIFFREQWLKIIARKKPTFNDKSSLVCSLHFKDTDYIPGLKRRRLIHGAIPSIFPSSYRNGHHHFIKSVPLSHKIQDSPESQTIQDSSMSQEIQDSPISPQKTPQTVVSLPSNKPTKETISVQTQTNISKSLLEALYKKKEALRKQNSRLQEKLEEMEATINIMKAQYDNVYHKNLDQIIRDSENTTEYKASNFLLEQVKNYCMIRPTWSVDCVRMCVPWHLASPKGYEYASKHDILNLPSRATLIRLKAKDIHNEEKFSSHIADEEIFIKSELQSDEEMDDYFESKDLIHAVKITESSTVNSSSEVVVPDSSEL